MKSEYAGCLIINAPEWFQRPEFLAILERPEGDRQTATWHAGGKADEYSDVFIVYDDGEGSDIFQEEGLEDIWDAICAEADRYRMKYGVVRIENIPEDSKDQTPSQ